MSRRAVKVGAASAGVLALVLACATPASSTSTAAGGQLTWSRPESVDPLRGGLLSVSCISPTFCLAGDAHGRVLSYDGSTWSAQAKVGPTDSAVGAINCVRESFCVAGIGKAVSTYRDGRWHTRHPGPDFVTGVDCVSTRFCVAVGYDGTFHRYDGTSWTGAHRFAPKDARVRGVSCAAASRCFAVGGDRVWRYDGSSWSSGRRIDKPYYNLVAVSCPSRSWCLAVDDIRGSFRFSEGVWHARKNMSGGRVITALDCAAVGRCTAGDDLGAVQSYAQGAWTAPRKVLVAQISDLSCASRQSCVAVTYHGLAATMTAAGWQPPTQADPLVGFSGPHYRYGPRGLSCASAHSCVIVDPNHAWLRYDGSSWTRPQRIGFRSDTDFARPLSCPSPTYCLSLQGVNTARELVDDHWRRPVHAPAIREMACESARTCVGVVDPAVWDGTRWRHAHHTPRARMVSVSCTRTFCVAGTADGSVVTYRDGRWSAPHPLVNLSAGGRLGVSCARGPFCLAYVQHGPDAGKAFQRISGTWSPAGRAFGGGSDSIRALSCANRSLCVAVTSESVSTYDGDQWTSGMQIASKKFGALAATSCAGRSTCVVMTADGHAVVGRAG